jgi:hypothetical protein
VIDARQQRPIAECGLFILSLHRRCALMALVSRLLFGRRWRRVNPAAAAVVANAARTAVINHGLVVSIAYRYRTEIVDGAIVLKRSAAPETTGIADTTVAKAVVHATIKSNMGTPVTAMPQKGAAQPAPVTGRPQ